MLLVGGSLSREAPISRTQIPGLSASARVEWRSPSELTPYPRNARTHSKKQIGQIRESIRRFGFTNPVLIDDGDMILAGHARVEAARELGLEAVPCLRMSTLSEAEKRAYILADNKLAQNAGWNEDLLAGELEYLVTQCEEIDIELTGFSIAEVDQLLDVGGTDQSAESTEDDHIPEVKGTAITRAGDVWTLGRSRLICGDAREEHTYVRLMSRAGGGLEQADMVFTDPPYNVPINGHVAGKGRTRHRDFTMASGEMSAAAFTAFLTSVFERLAAYTRDGSIHFVCMDWRHLSEILEAGGAVYSELKNLIVWVKDNGGMGSFYRSRHELVFAFKNGTAAPHQLLRARPERALPDERLELSGNHVANAGVAGSARAAPDREARGDGGRCAEGHLPAGRTRPRRLLRVGNDLDRGAEDRPARASDRDRPPLLRRRDQALADLCQGRRRSCRDRRDVRRGRGTPVSRERQVRERAAPAP